MNGYESILLFFAALWLGVSIAYAGQQIRIGIETAGHYIRISKE